MGQQTGSASLDDIQESPQSGTASLDDVQEVAPAATSPSLSAADADKEFDRITNPSGAALPAPTTSAPVSLGTAPRSIAEGQFTEGREQRGGAPLHRRQNPPLSPQAIVSPETFTPTTPATSTLDNAAQPAAPTEIAPVPIVPQKNRYTALQPQLQPDVEKELGDILETEKGAVTGIPQALKGELVTPSGRKNLAMGLAKVAKGIGVATIPEAPFAMAAAPVAAVGGFVTGEGASRLVRAAVHGKVDPETEDAVATLAFWAPGMLGEALGVNSSRLPEGFQGGTASALGDRVAAGVARDPNTGETILAGKLGSRRGAVRFGGSTPAGPGIEPPTVEGQVAPPTPADEAVGTLARADQATAQAKRTVAGVPPKPAPTPPTPTHFPIEEVDHAAGVIANLPPDLRSKAMIEAHERMSQMLQQQPGGKIVGPDGKLEVIKTPQDAERLAQKWLNDAVDRFDTQQAETEKASSKTPQAEIPKPAEAVTPAPEVNTASLDDVEAPETQSASLDDIEAPAAAGAQESTSQPPKAGADLYKKGDRVTLDDGRSGEVAFAHPKDSIVRVKLDKGGTTAVGLSRVQPEGVQNENSSVPPEKGATPAIEKVDASAYSAGAFADEFEGRKVRLADGKTGTITGQEQGGQIRVKYDDQSGPTAVWTSHRKVEILAKGDESAEKAPAHKHNSSQINLPDDLAAKVQAAGKIIPEKDLAGEGREPESHITLKYGVADDAEEKLRDKLATVQPFEATLGKTDVFPPSEHSDNASVVHAAVESPELHKLKDLVNQHAGVREDNFPYKPHVTLAYVKPEVAHKYKGRTDLKGVKVPVKSVTISKKDGTQVEIPLGAKAEKIADNSFRSNKDRFSEAYGRHLEQAIRSNPTQYTTKPEGAKDLAQRMTESLAKGTANKDSKPIRATLKELGIKDTYSAIREFLNAPSESEKSEAAVPNPKAAAAAGEAAPGTAEARPGSGERPGAGGNQPAAAGGLSEHGEPAPPEVPVASEDRIPEPVSGKGSVDRGTEAHVPGVAGEALVPAGKGEHYVILAGKGAPRLKVRVKYATDASQAVQAYRDKYGLGSSDMAEDFGDIHDGAGKVVAHVSYNGRVWEGTARTWKPGAKLLQERTALPGETPDENAQSGEHVRIMGVDSTLVESQTHDGVRYDLFRATDPEDQSGAIRVFDRDSGNVANIKRYPTMDAARAAYDKTVAIVSGSGEKPVATEENGATIPADEGVAGGETSTEGRRPLRTAESEGGSAVESGPPGLREPATQGEPPESSAGPGSGERHPHPAPSGSARPSTESGAGTGERSPVPANRPLATPKQRFNDWFTHPEDFSIDATDSTRLQWNLDALKILKDLGEGDRLTDAQRESLARFVGWGALDRVFDSRFNRYGNDQWARTWKEVQDLMTPEQIDAARRSTQNAHYTSPQIVRWVWSALKRMGFSGGVVIEPSGGSGNFLGMMPKAIREGLTQAIYNELDPITYRIGSLLYPSADSFNRDFVDLMLPNDSVDLAISNVPFGVRVYDKQYKALNRVPIHDYFFVKSMDKVRPGGVVSFITSTYTMDKLSPDIRELLSGQADLLFAVRMPQDTFAKSAGTAVSADLLVLRKRVPGEKPKGEPWTKLGKTKAPYAEYMDKYGEGEKSINEYFIKHPENLLGRLEIGRGRTSADAEDLVVVSTQDFEQRLKDALDRVPRGVLKGQIASTPVSAPESGNSFAPETLEDGNFYIDENGVPLQKLDGVGRPTGVILDSKGKASLLLRDRLKRLIGIRDKTRELMHTMRTLPDEPDVNKQIEKLQKDLQKDVADYRERHGWFAESRTRNVFEQDPHYPLILSLEHYDRAVKKGTPADILSKRTQYPPRKLTALSEDPKEALYQVLAERGRPDLEFMAQMRGEDLESMAKDLADAGLIFREPNTGLWETPEKYLSGFVRDKLVDAEKAVAQGRKEFKPNVESLKKALPARVPINSEDPKKNIEVKLGSTWIEPKVVEAFIREVFHAGAPKVLNSHGMWNVEAGASTELKQNYSTQRLSGLDLLESSLNQRTAVVKDTISLGEGKTKDVVNPEETIKARRVQEKIAKEFAAWARNHPTFGPQLEESYNQVINAIVPPTYNGAHLTLPGMNTSILRSGRLEPHQLDAVWRQVQEGRALLAHVVGAGKTFEMIAGAMELKRLGLIRKPLFAVPNHLVGQWAADFIRLYPGARVLAPNPKSDFTAINRNKTMSRIATGQWEAIIVPHSQFNLMDIGAEWQQKTIQRELEELEETLKAAERQEKSKAQGKKKSFTVKRLEKARDNLRGQLEQLKDLKADKTVRFDDLGVDHLVVDEAHEYKNLPFYTKMDRVAGLSQGDAKRALRLKMKTDYLYEKHGNRGVVFATGTPIQNTMAELYTMIRYVAPDVLERAGIRFFDDWAANFGRVITAMELGVDGRTYRPRSKFIQFTNLPELQMMFRAFADVKTAEDLNLPVPKLEGGRPMDLTAKTSPEQEKYVKELIRRARILRGEAVPVEDEQGNPVMEDVLDKDGQPTGKKRQKMEHHERPDPTEDNMLKVTGDGRKAANDYRLIDPSAPDNPESKINKIVDKILEEWTQGKVSKDIDPATGKPLENLTGLVFLDNYQFLAHDLGLAPALQPSAKTGLTDIKEWTGPKSAPSITKKWGTNGAATDSGVLTNGHVLITPHADLPAAFRMALNKAPHGNTIRPEAIEKVTKDAIAASTSPAKVEGVLPRDKKEGPPYVYLSGSNGTVVAADADLFAMIEKNVPHTKIMVGESPKSPILFYQGKQAVALMMGINNAPSLVEARGTTYTPPQTKVQKSAKKEAVLLNLYRDMVDKLVKRGIPREQLAVIHDFAKPEQKLDLFDKMNSGAIRVLFGSTQKMGAGMNAQERMKWLIDSDSPWRPGDLEQRHGRLVRQGNKNKTVRIHYAVTKGTFDSYMLQTLKDKASFIHQIISGKDVGRTVTDAAGDMVLSLEEMLAVSSNNPDVKRKMELEAELATLRVLEQESSAKKYRQEREAQREHDISESSATYASAWQKVYDDWTSVTGPGKDDEAIANLRSEIEDKRAQYNNAAGSFNLKEKNIGEAQKKVDKLAKKVEAGKASEQEVATLKDWKNQIDSATAENEKLGKEQVLPLKQELKDMRGKLAELEGARPFQLELLGQKFTTYKDAHAFMEAEKFPKMALHGVINKVPFRIEPGSAYSIASKRDEAVLHYTVGPFAETHDVSDLSSFLGSITGFMRPALMQARVKDYQYRTTQHAETAKELAKLAASDKGFEDADQLAAAEKELGEVKQRLGLTDDVLAQSQEVAADVGDSGDDTPQTSGPEDDEEPTTFGLTLIPPGTIDAAARMLKHFYQADVAPLLEKGAGGMQQAVSLFTRAFYPRLDEDALLNKVAGTAAPSDVVDSLMKLKGDRTKALAKFDLVMTGVEKMFDHLSDDQRVDFVNRIQTGQKQASPEMQGLADAFKQIMDQERAQEQESANLGRRGGKVLELSRKENYFPNRWKTKPGGEEPDTDAERIEQIATPKRLVRKPLEGTKGYNKRQSYTLLQGIKEGGTPETTNPVRILRRRLEDGMAFVTARRAWHELKELDQRKFLKPGERIPPGFDEIDDKIAKVYFPAQLEFPGSEEPTTVAHQIGRWVVQANSARLLNNMLSKDYIRGNAVGRGLLWLKNASTAVELGISPFHAVFESIEAMSSQFALGMLRSYNLGLRTSSPEEFAKGLREMLLSPAAPLTMAKEGAALPAYIEARARLANVGLTQYGQIISGDQPHGVKEAISHFLELRKQKSIEGLLKRYPDLDQLVDDMFAGGMNLGQHQDYKTKLNDKSFMEAWTEGNPVGALLLRGVPTLSQAVMSPLFQWYIPNLKYSLFMRLMSEQALEHARELEAGTLTREKLARQVVDSVENRFGELNFDNLFWNKTLKSALQFMFRSVTWKGGSAREFAGALRDAADWAYNAGKVLGGKKLESDEDATGGEKYIPRMGMRSSWLFSLVLYTVAIGTVFSKVMSGKWPWEWAADELGKRGEQPGEDKAEYARQIYIETVHPRSGDLDSRDNPVRSSLPTYWKEAESASDHPGKWLMGSMSGMLSKGIDVAHNEDYFGNYVYNPNGVWWKKVLQAGKYVAPTPFSVTNFERERQMGEGKTKYLAAIGFPRAPSDLNFTPLEKRMVDITRAGEPRHTPEELEAWRKKREELEQGTASRADVKAWVKMQRESWLERKFKGLTYAEAVEVYSLANPIEAQILTPILRKKRKTMLQRHRGAEVQEAETEQ